MIYQNRVLMVFPQMMHLKKLLVQSADPCEQPKTTKMSSECTYDRTYFHFKNSYLLINRYKFNKISSCVQSILYHIYFSFCLYLLIQTLLNLSASYPFSSPLWNPFPNLSRQTFQFEDWTCKAAHRRSILLCNVGWKIFWRWPHDGQYYCTIFRFVQKIVFHKFQ